MIQATQDAMQYPIVFDYPAKTFSRTALGVACFSLGGFGVLYNIVNNPLNNVMGSILALATATYGAGILWSMLRPQQIRLTADELQLPPTILSTTGKSIPYEDIIGISLIPRKWGRTAIIMSVGHKFSFTTHVIGQANMFKLIELIHAHAPHLGDPAIGTLGGLFRAGQRG